MIDYAMTYDEIAEAMGVSRQLVAQLETNALKKIGRRMQIHVQSLEEKRAQAENRRATWDWAEKYDRLYRERLLCGQELENRKAAGNGSHKE